MKKNFAAIIFLAGIAIVSIAFLLIRFQPDIRSAVAGRIFARADYYFNGGAYDLAKAEKWYRLALIVDPNLRNGHYQLARVYFVGNKFGEGNSLEKALAEINTEISLYPENQHSYYVRGLINGYRKDYDAAIGDFGKITGWALGERNGWAAYNDLAWVYHEKGDYQNAKKAVLAGLEKFPENVWLINGLGAAELGLGEFAEAQKNFEKAGKLAKNLTLSDWRNAYPGDDPANYGDSLQNFQSNLRQNLGLASKKIAKGGIFASACSLTTYGWCDGKISACQAFSCDPDHEKCVPTCDLGHNTCRTPTPTCTPGCGSWGVCSVACGGGTQTQTCTRANCSTYNKSQPCNTQACPTHNECQNGTCVSVNGSGTDACSPVSSACAPTPTLTPTLTHNECQNGTCVSVNGSGTDACSPVSSACSVSGTLYQCQSGSCGGCSYADQAGLNACQAGGYSQDLATCQSSCTAPTQEYYSCSGDPGYSCSVINCPSADPRCLFGTYSDLSSCQSSCVPWTPPPPPPPEMTVDLTVTPDRQKIIDAGITFVRGQPTGGKFLGFYNWLSGPISTSTPGQYDFRIGEWNNFGGWSVNDTDFSYTFWCNRSSGFTNPNDIYKGCIGGGTSEVFCSDQTKTWDWQVSYGWNDYLNGWSGSPNAVLTAPPLGLCDSTYKNAGSYTAYAVVTVSRRGIGGGGLTGHASLPITITGGVSSSHNVCQGNACVSVSGAGADACSVNSDCAPPSVTLTAVTPYGSYNSPSSATIGVGQSVNLNWTSTGVNPNGCTASGGSPGWPGFNYPAQDSSSAYTYTPSPGTYIYTITCTGPGGIAQSSVTVDVRQPVLNLAIRDKSCSVVDLLWFWTDAYSDYLNKTMYYQVWRDGVLIADNISASVSAYQDTNGGSSFASDHSYSYQVKAVRSVSPNLVASAAIQAVPCPSLPHWQEVIPR